MLYFIGKKNNPQIALLSKIAGENKVCFVPVDIDDPETSISISEDEIILNGTVPEEHSVFYLSDVYYQFPFIPEEPRFADWSMFQDFHLSQQQKKSQLYSLLYLLSEENGKYTVINNFRKSVNLTSKYEILERFRSAGLEVPAACLTNSIKKASLMCEKYGGILWSYPELGSPIRKISSERLEKLFGKGTSSLPYLMYESKAGSLIRLAFFEENPLLVSFISPPERESFAEELERFSHYIPDEALKRLGGILHGLFGQSFYEVSGVLDNENIFWFYDISFDPNVTYMNPNAQEYILSRLLENLLKKEGIDKKILSELQNQGKRKTIFLKRMLVHLFELQQKQE